ncbi:MAG: DUF2089 family protein [Verrucomicrobiota bacterium]|jgi:hypothetical protein
MEPGARAVPPWTRILSEEDWQFLKRFLLASGSLKDLASEYDISYPTVRDRLDRLIEKVRAADRPGSDDSFKLYIRSLVIDGHLMGPIAREILHLHENSKRERNVNDRNI